MVKHYDTCLPQYDEDPVQRLAALQEKRLRYQYVIHAPGMPAQVSRLPEDETFSDSYKVGSLVQIFVPPAIGSQFSVALEVLPSYLYPVFSCLSTVSVLVCVSLFIGPIHFATSEVRGSF